MTTPEDDKTQQPQQGKQPKTAKAVVEQVKAKIKEGKIKAFETKAAENIRKQDENTVKILELTKQNTLLDEELQQLGEEVFTNL